MFLPFRHPERSRRISKCASRDPSPSSRLRMTMSLHHLHEMRNLGDHPAHFLGVGTLADAVHLSEAEGFERLAHLARAADAAPDLLHFDGLPFGAHASAASSPLPRRARAPFSVRSCLRASKVALTTLCGLAVPSDLVRMFWIPADSRMARTGPPAMTPVPSEAGLSSTLPAP